MSTVEVISAGPLTTIQDLGRPGFAHIGVPRSGAADRDSLVLANRLVGNSDGAPALETTLVGPRLRVEAATVLALAGAPVAGIAMNEAFTLGAGEKLEIGTARTGLRTYIAFQGGIEAPLTLGSAATDTLTGLGPPPLRPGDLLRLAGVSVRNDLYASISDTCPRGAAVLAVVLGPRDDWFTAKALKLLCGTPFTVTAQSSRIGLRLDGPALDRARSGELPSEGLVAGAIQVPPNGRPILLLVDHPTTGGYPVIATVLSTSLRFAAQLRPGQRVRFRIAPRSGATPLM
ncbi:MAG: biotin-dependent carboxyltransferase family protein [Solirubrobacteraceae bacterium]